MLLQCTSRYLYGHSTLLIFAFVNTNQTPITISCTVKICKPDRMCSISRRDSGQYTVLGVLARACNVRVGDLLPINRTGECLNRSNYFVRAERLLESILIELQPRLLDHLHLPVGGIFLRHNIMSHGYADDTQMYCYVNPRNPTSLQSALRSTECCLNELGQWMVVNKLKLNA